MSDIREGDLVEAVKGEDRIVARVVKSAFGNPYVSVASCVRRLDWLTADGWTLTVIEKAAPPLPTEPGWYRSSLEDSTSAYSLTRAGMWREHTRDGKVFVRGDGRDMNWLPFTRLEAVPDTAARVLAAVESEFAPVSRPAILTRLRTEFGVTS